MNPLLRFFKGRRMQTEIEDLRAQVAALSDQCAELEQLADKIEGEPLPEIDGLSIEGRRIVNTAIIALAQHLVLHFSGNKLASTAREAMHRTVGDMRFGDRRECDRMVDTIRARIADLKEEARLPDIVKSRAAQISRELEYRNDSDSVPTVVSVQTIMPSAGQPDNNRRSSDAPIKINVLADDYWDLTQYLR
jgi:hypothetical protein